MKQYLSVLWILLFVFGCKKKEKSQTSTWTVNGETFTAVAIPSVGKAIAILSSNDINNRFSITFYTSYLPTNGSWVIGNDPSTPNPSYSYMSFYYNGIFYIYPAGQSAALIASTTGEKVHYALSPTWFINYYNYSDSVLISGNFYEP